MHSCLHTDAAYADRGAFYNTPCIRLSVSRQLFPVRDQHILLVAVIQYSAMGSYRVFRNRRNAFRPSVVHL